MTVKINKILYLIEGTKYNELLHQKSISIKINDVEFSYFKNWFDSYESIDLEVFNDGKNVGKLTNCHVIEINGRKYIEGTEYNVEIEFRESVNKPEKINIELHSIQVPENKNLIRTEMEKGVLFTYEDKIPPTKKVPENDYNNEYREKERVKCRKDIVYFIEKYLTLFDVKTRNKIPFILTNNQKLILRNQEEYNINVIETYRQSGLSTLYAAKIAHGMIFKENKIRSAYCGSKGELNNRVIKLVGEFMAEALNQLPFYGLQYMKNNKDEILLNNGNHFKTFILNSRQLIPQYLVKEATDLIVDDAAFNGLTIGILEELYDRNKGLRTIISSVKYLEPNNFNQINNSRNKTYLNLNIFKIYWHDDERFNQDLKWYPIEYYINVYGGYITKTAYIPGNEWYSRMCQIMDKTVETEVGVGFNPYKINKEDNNINIKQVWV